MTTAVALIILLVVLRTVTTIFAEKVEHFASAACARRNVAPRINITLNMIVKNEVNVLPRLFLSVKDYIDYYVIVDTGSTDGTINLIRNEMAKYCINGEVHEREWVNFGVNRQQALELAVQARQSGWLLFIDADEELSVSNPQFYETLVPGVSYNIQKRYGDLRYTLPNLVDISRTRWHWEGVVHEYLWNEDGTFVNNVLEDVWIIIHEGEGARSRGITEEEKFLRDAALLEDDLKQHPENSRSQFYLGQSYKDAGHYEKARQAYRKRVAMEGWREEMFYAQLEVGKLSIVLNEPMEIVLKELLAAYEMRPSRAEPLYELAQYFRLQNMFNHGYIFASVGSTVPRPDDSLFVQTSVYDWKLLDELCILAYWAGKMDQGKSACEEILHRANDVGLQISPDDLDRVERNLQFFENTEPAGKSSLPESKSDSECMEPENSLNVIAL